MSRVASHWKINGKEKQLTLFRSRIISFHNAMNMNLQMINVCLFLRAQETNTAKQKNVLEGVTQLREQIKQLSKLSQSRRNERESVSTTVLRSLDVAVALDESANATTHGPHSDNLSTAQEPSSKARGWIQSKPISNTSTNESAPGRKGFHASTNTFQNAKIPHVQAKAELDQPATEEQCYIRELQTARDLLNRDHTERAKSLCRRVINETQLNVGTMQLLHNEAIELLAHIYEYTGDNQEAAKLRLLLNISGRNTIQKDFKALMQKGDMKKSIDYAFQWEVLLSGNSALQMYRACLDGLEKDQGFSGPVLFAAVCMMGNTLLAQTLLARGYLIHSSVYCGWAKGKTITPLGCAIRLGHYRLVQILLDTGSNSTDAIVATNIFELAIEGLNIEVLRILLEHACLLTKGLQTGDMVANRFRSTAREMLEVGEMLAKKSKITIGPCDPWKSLLNVLHKAISQKDQAMTKLLLSYGIRSPDTIQLITRMNWLEGVQVAATQASHVSEEDITYAFQSRNLDICNYLLSLNPKCATSVTNDAMEGAGIEGLQMVIKFGANVNHPVYWSSAKRMGPLYPLHFAVHIGSSEMVKTLLAAGADVRNQDEVGQTALQFAIKKGQRKDLPEKGISATMGIVALLKGVEPRKTNSGATTSSYRKGSSLRSWWSSSKRHQAAATVGN